MLKHVNVSVIPKCNIFTLPFLSAHQIATITCAGNRSLFFSQNIDIKPAGPMCF